MTALRIALLSDLHLDVRRRRLERAGLDGRAAQAEIDALGREAADTARAAGADLMILAGDIANGTTGMEWAARCFGALPVLYVAGNHEFYGHDQATLVRHLRTTAAATETVRFLECDAADITAHGRTIRVLGCTAWTDYQLYGADAAAEAMTAAEAVLYDHSRIHHGEQLFKPADARALNRTATGWLQAELAAARPDDTIVVTHHAPAPASVEPRFEGSPLSPAFVSDMTAMMLTHGPALWIHGHTHHNVDYRVGQTRVVSHQWGYPDENLPMGVAILSI